MIIDNAPGKGEIEVFVKSGNFSDLLAFFWLRMNWCGGYPLIHDRCFTNGAFDDLIEELSAEQRIALIPEMMRFTKSVPDRYFHGALFLLAQLIPDDRVSVRPEDFSNSFCSLRPRAEKLAFLPNLECAWDALAEKQRYLKSAGDPLSTCSASQLRGLKPKWQTIFPMPLKNIQGNFEIRCPASHIQMSDWMKGLGCVDDSQDLIYVTDIESTRYWVWRLPGEKGTAHLWRIAFLRQPKIDDLEVGHWDLYRQFGELDTPDAISSRLLKIEFYPAPLKKLTDKDDDGNSPI